MSKDLKKRGFNFVGSTICYAFMQAVGMVNDHRVECFRYAQEASWREDNRRLSNGEQVHRVAGLSMKHKPSVDFSGYWQRHVKS